MVRCMSGTFTINERTEKMTPEMWFLCAVIVTAIVLFVTEKVSIDVTSIFIAFVLMASGLVSIPEGLSGFSNQAALAILALLILNTGLEKTGVLRVMTKRLVDLTGNKPWTVLLVLLPFVAVLSAFTNNTAVIAIFLPVLLLLGDSKGISPSKLLMPVAFISILGGLCTIIGTSTNLLVNSIARQYGIPPFTFFEFTSIGAAMAGVGILYVLLVGHRLIPARRRPLDREAAARKQYISEIAILPSSTLIGTVAAMRETLAPMGLEIARITTPSGRRVVTDDSDHLQEGDRILLRGNPGQISRLKADPSFAMTARFSEDRIKLNKQETHLVEAVVAPGSDLIAQRIQDIDLLGRFDAVLLGLQRSSRLKTSALAENRLRMGDVVLLEATGRFVSDPEIARDFILLESMPMAQSRRKRTLAVVIFVISIAAAGLGLVPIVIATLGGVLAMAITKCIDMTDAYKRVEWKVYFLIAGLIPLGIALQNTGLDDLIAAGFTSATHGSGGFAVIVILYAFTALVTNVMANNATALLMAPIAIKIANQLGIDPKALLLTVMFAASTSFFTPVGYHTLTLIYTPGRYRFRDYFYTGLPLTLLVGAVACWMIWQRYAPD